MGLDAQLACFTNQFLFHFNNIESQVFYDML